MPNEANNAVEVLQLGREELPEVQENKRFNDNEEAEEAQRKHGWPSGQVSKRIHKLHSARARHGTARHGTTHTFALGSCLL